MAKQVMLFDSLQHGFYSFSWRLQIKTYSQSLLLHELKFPVKKILLQNFVLYTGKMLFANASKIIRNWFLALQPDIFKIICNLLNGPQERAWK